MRLHLLLIFGAVVQQTIPVAAAGGMDDLLSRYLQDLWQHLLDMKLFFCRYCQQDCMSGQRPEIPPEWVPPARRPPQLPFWYPDEWAWGQFPQQRNEAGCRQACNARYPSYMSYQYNLWMQARLASPDWTKAVGDAFLFHQIQILQDFFEQEGDCGKGGGGGGRGGPKNPAQYGMRLPKRDVDELWREFKKKKDLGKVKEPVAAKLHALSSSPPPVQPPDATKSSIIKCQEQVNRWPTIRWIAGACNSIKSVPTLPQNVNLAPPRSLPAFSPGIRGIFWRMLAQ